MKIESLKIYLQTKHIKAGVRGSDTDCPVALAVGETLRDFRVEVSPALIQLFPVKRFEAVWFVTMSEAVQNFTKDFDNGRLVEPFAFDLINWGYAGLQYHVPHHVPPIYSIYKCDYVYRGIFSHI